MRRFTRLTNAFSKKLDNHIHALALYFAFYNFFRTHKTLRISPAMAAGIAKRLWSMEDVVALIDVSNGPGSEAARALQEVCSLEVARCHDVNINQAHGCIRRRGLG